MSEGGGTKADDPASGGGRSRWAWVVDLVKVLALPLVTLFLGYLFNSSLNERQQIDTNTRLYAEILGRREEADSNLRKDMFNSILSTFIVKDPTSRLTSAELIRQQILSLELLAYNFHESLDIGPLFKDVERRIAVEDRKDNAELRGRLESVALQVIEHQMTALADVGTVERGNALPSKINDLQAYVSFGTHTVADPQVPAGEAAPRLCLSTESTDGSRRYRQFKLELVGYDEAAREIQAHLYVSRPLTPEDCQQASLDLPANREIDTNFRVGLFDFPMIDNTRLSGSERTAVSLTALTPDVVSVAVVYFPASRASLKDKPYYDEVLQDLVRGRQRAGSMLSR